MDLNWSNDKAIGIHIIDTQHKSLINRIKKLSQAIENGREKLEVRQMIAFLDDYTKSHFLVEEQYMVKYKYPLYAFHKKQHDEFIRMFEKLKREFEKNSVDGEIAQQLQSELNQHIAEHITVIDAELGKFLKSKNVT